MPSFSTKEPSRQQFCRRQPAPYDFLEGSRRRATEPKELFVVVQLLGSGQCLIPNIGRAVAQTVQAYRDAVEDLTRIRSFTKAWMGEFSGSAAAPKPLLGGGRDSPQELLRRLAAAYCQAEENGTADELKAGIVRAISLSTKATPPEPEDFLDRARRLDQRGRTDAALDIVYDQIDEMLLAGKVGEVDQRLANADTSRYSVDLLLALLTITLAAKPHLPSRAVFFTRADATLRARGEWEESLLVGLE
jgi:hypothetical protein